CRPGCALACRGGDGAGLRRRAAQHRGRRGRRSGGNGARPRARRRCQPRAPGPSRRPRCSARPCWEASSLLDPFYPVVPDASWVKRLVPIGTRLIQLRIKDQPAEEIGRQVREARDLCVVHGAQLIVNDYWQTAIDEGCPWVHLGQEDLLDADIKALRRAGIKIGVSPHDHTQREKGLAIDPDYVALGPIWPTLL